MRRTNLTTATVLCAAVLLGACTSDETNAFDRDRFNTMLEQGRVSENDLTGVIERLAKGCMEDRGFTVHPLKMEAPPTATAVPAANSNIEVVMRARYMYQTDTLDESGYGASPFEDLGFTPGGSDSPFADDPFSELPDEEQLEYWLAYDGSYLGNGYPDAQPPEGSYETVAVDGREYQYPNSGCYAEIQDEVFEGDIHGYLTVAHWATEGMGYVGYGEFHDHSDVAVALDDWSVCMSDNGYPDLADPTDAIQLARDLYRDADVFGPVDEGFEDLKQQEIVIAQTDYGCNVEAELDERQVEIFWSILEPYVVEHEAEIYAWKDLTDQALERAQAMLAS
ncbi:hypothetical protein FB566_2243 [Stackebrandtia endophytica]|uniref:Uncharacterized protein n=1 Tax=Stackebrandtia endophytica TaxID=1496996 RepID=A0A543AVU6_9ACTN|nr:hypothetical protein [Stackebrandtia endophytica]TQL76708.1 hypothetical protein FB566_2243 [Stackebrandtia endophytica]